AKNKPINVPNKCPFKEEILNEAEKERERIETERLERKKAGKQPNATLVGGKRKLDIANDLEELVAKASKNADGMPNRLNGEDESEKKLEEIREKTLKQYASEVRKTIESADIIIEVVISLILISCA
ncbi:unnamed protein product, partial [Gongylonema pulchrum]|uniref:GN3L_Grn1 domain-containing protein n=1 Tax=Gongylonema pulchrum TaxID=637853 RepID=A0A183EYN6_9BILA